MKSVGGKTALQIKGGIKGEPGGRRPHQGRTYRPGETVRQSGIYDVLHERDHRKPHEAVMVSGDQFPFCDYCNERVRFRLSRAAPYIFHDEDFEGYEA